MRFREFNNIKIDDDIGVSPVGKDTKLIAKSLRNLKFKSALDVGTGTGFIPIYLKTLGLKCEGIDINSLAIECARKNAEKNKVRIKFYISNLFENVKGNFDLIVFNPPYGNVKSASLSKYLEIVKSLLPKENRIISRASFQLIKKQRARLITSFLNQAQKFIKNKGSIAILLDKSESQLVKKFQFKIIAKDKNLRVVLLKF